MKAYAKITALDPERKMTATRHRPRKDAFFFERKNYYELRGAVNYGQPANYFIYQKISIRREQVSEQEVVDFQQQLPNNSEGNRCCQSLRNIVIYIINVRSNFGTICLDC